ncbi:MAG: ABC transporter, substrate-binding protein (cluster 12, methionine/phosphonates) [uncultured Chloroflexi bacterium]|uniref:ABC transporter, substrate-binding protein (Cluster 12, methionine/phosphonates) n=1 Tax=uncultured Chloroflexota bacterium TaxID=166587 RepID=A0A6J4JDE2_9CHLR|nr:MAG: ABC transporter, substrate-binding protein (cluster 12, methionine/phosphonates) [uncultured Chloroflexota bacterium]
MKIYPTPRFSRRSVVRRTSALAAGLALATGGSALAACGAPSGPAVGSAEKPLVMAFTPSADTQKILLSGQPLADLLEKETGYKFKTEVPTGYAPLVEAMGANKVDVAWLAPFGYAVARKKHEVEVILGTVRSGSKTYPWQIIVHADSGIKTLDDLKGKRFAFGDALSTSNYLYPAAYIKEKYNLDADKFFSNVQFAGGHDKVAIAVYNKQVDGGATFGPNLGQPESDGRSRALSSVPDIMQKVVRILETDKIPNDTVSVRKGLPKEVTQKLKSGLLAVSKTDQGKKLLKDLYSIDGLDEASAADYDPIIKKAGLVGVDIEVAAGIKAAPTATKAP